MCERNSPDKNEASTGCMGNYTEFFCFFVCLFLRKEKEKRKKRERNQYGMSKRNSPDKTKTKK